MKSGSSVVLNTSFVTETGTPYFSVYSAAKAAVKSFIKPLPLNLQKKVSV